MRFYYIASAPAAIRWQRTQDEARATAKEHGGHFEPVEVPTDQRGLLVFLNANEELDRTASAAPAPDVPPPVEPKPCVARQSLQLDEDFDALPLARQLDLAARAMENARDGIGK